MSNQQATNIQQFEKSSEDQLLQAEKRLKSNTGSFSCLEPKNQEQATTEANETKEKPKVVISQAKIFAKKPSIFREKHQNPSIGNIFANQKSVNLFNIKPSQSNQQTLNIFTLATNCQPLIKNEVEDDLLSQNSQDSAGDSVKQGLNEPTQKVMKYNYGEQMEKIGDFKVNKFKNGVSATKEGIMRLSLEKQKEGKSNIIYLIIRTESTKISIYQSFLLQNTKSQRFSTKEQSIKLWTICSSKKKQILVPQRQLLKIQFENVDQAKRFNQTIETQFRTKVQ